MLCHFDNVSVGNGSLTVDCCIAVSVNCNANWSEIPMNTLLTLLRQYRCLTTTNLCLLMWNHCSPVFEENGKLPCLDCLVSRDNKELRTTVYRKPTHTDRLLDESSYNPASHKVTSIKTLTRRAQLVCDTPDSLLDENRYLGRVFHKNNYNPDFIRRNNYRPTEADATNRNPTSVTTVTIPCIKQSGISR